MKWFVLNLAGTRDGALFAPSGILNDKIVESLAPVGPVLQLIELESVVGAQWPWFGRYGDELLSISHHASRL